MARLRFASPVGVACFLALGSGVLLVRAGGEAGKLADPLPIRRVLLSPDRLAAELKKADGGAFRRLDRAEFERVVQAAARGAAADPAPRLAEAKFRAKLIDDSAGRTPGLSGTAQWKVVHPGDRSVLLRLGDGPADLNFTLRNPRFDNRDAILTRFPAPERGKGVSGLALRVDRPGDHTLTMDWSIRAETRPEGLFVDLRIPACPAAELELELPVDRTLAVVGRLGVGDEPLVSGPHPADAADRRVWRVACGGRSHLPLLVRRTPSAPGESVVMAWQETVQRLSPDGLESATTFSIESIHRGVRELVFVLDQTLRPTEVISADLEGWRPEPGGNRIRVRLSHPLRKCTVEVRALAPLGPTPERRKPGKAMLMPWTSPAIALERAVPRGESLEIWIHPELRLLTWEPGDFRLVDSAVVTEAEGKSKRRRLTLQGGGISPAKGGPRRPGGTIQEGSVEYLVTERLWWRPRADTMELTARLECRVRQGQMFQIPLRLPKGWDVEGVELDPADRLRGYDVRGGPDNQTLLVDLRRALVPRAEGGPEGTTGTLTVRLRPHGPGPWTGRDLPFPEVIPLGARLQSGGLAIDYDERLFRGHIQTSLTAGESPPVASLWGEAGPDRYYPFRGDTLRGSFRFVARPPRSRAGVRTEALLLPDRLSVEARVRLEVESGETARVDLFVSGREGADGWGWTTADNRPGEPRIRRVVRRVEGELGLAVAGVGGGVLNRVTLEATRCRGAFWSIEFDRPLHLDAPLTLIGRSTRLRGGEGTDRCPIPLVSVRDAVSMAGDLTLSAPGSEIVEKSSHQVRATGTHDFRWIDPGAWLTVRTRPTAGPRPAGATIDRACITTVLSLQGDLRHHVRFRVANWRKSHLPVPLPPGAKLLAASVDRRWLEPTALLDGEGVAQLPILDGPTPTRAELLFSTPADDFRVGCRLDSPFPDLPLTPVALRRHWLFPPGVAPLAEGGLVPGCAASGEPGTSVPARLLRLLRLGPDPATLASFGLPATETTLSGPDPQALADAFAGLRKERGGQRVRLDRVVEDLVSGYLRDRCPVLVDRTALWRGGWTAASVLTIRKPSEGDGVGPWDEAGPVVVPCRGGVLLTTRAAARRLPADRVDATLDEADPSGRFSSALEWLTGPGVMPGLLGPGAKWEGWSSWTVRAGRIDTGAVWVVRESSPAAGGVLLACVLGVLLLRRRGAARPLLLAWVGLFGLAALWLPSSLRDLVWLPLVAGLAASVTFYLAWASRRRKPDAVPSAVGRPSLESASIAGVVLVFMLAPWGRAQRPDVSTVYLLEASGKAKPAVLVPVSLLERLRTLVRPADVGGAKPVLVSSEVSGRVAGGRAEFSAVFVAHAFDEEAATLVLPLEGGQLVGDVLVDGVRVLPEARPKPAAGYVIPLRGQGRHKIELRFQVALSTPAGRDADAGRTQVAFRLPSVPQSRLTFRLPEGATALEVPARLGPLRTVVEGKARSLEADLGALTTPIQVRWDRESKPPRPARVSVREAHLWDLRSDASLLTTFLQYDIRGSGVGSLAVTIPDGLEVSSAQARRPGRGVAGDTPVRLSNWHVLGGRPRTLRLEFAAQVGGEIEVVLQLVPREPWSKSVLLPIPRPRDTLADKAMAYLAYRTQGIDATRVEWLRLNGIAVAEFAPFWPAATRPTTSAIEYASTFSADARQGPELRLDMRPVLPRVRARHAVVATVGPALAEWHARIGLTAREKNLSLAQWDIRPAKSLTISAVQGAAVSRWVQSGGRLTVWFEKTTEAVKLDVSGWVPLDATPGKPSGNPRLELPCLLAVGMPETETTLEIAGGEGIALTPTAVRHLQSDPSGAGRKFHATRPDYSAVFLVRPGPPVAASLRTTARLEGREVVFETDIRAKMPADLRTLEVRMRGWEGEASLEVKAGTAVRRGERQRRGPGPRERLWSLDFAPSPTGEVRLRLAGRIPAADGIGAVRLPDVKLPGVRAGRVLVVDPSLLAEVVPASGVEGASRSWLLPDGATARVVPRDPPPPPAVRALFAEQVSRLADGRRWLHEYRCWVHHAGPTEAVLRWPVQVEVVSASVGTIDGPGTPLTSAPEGDGVWRIALPATGTAHAITIRYRRPKGETASKPDLRAPTLEGATPVRLSRTIDVPPGWRLAGDTEHAVAGATRRVLASLVRAAGLLEVCRDSAGRAESPEDNRTRERFERFLVLAQVGMNAGGDGSRPLGPAGETLQGWLARLKRERRGLPRGIGGIPPSVDEDEAGAPASWIADPAEAPPAWRLEPIRALAARQAFVLSVEWLALLAVVALISVSSFSRAVARHLWPEQLVALGFVSWNFAGSGLPAVALILFGIVGRSAVAIRGVRALLRRRPEGGGSGFRSRA